MLCACGCGKETSLATYNCKARGYVKGQPLRFIKCHRIYPSREVAERFWSYVDKSGGPDACWPWKAYLRKDGHARFYVDGRQKPAHRVAYELTYGPMPAGLFACHRCNNAPCCNPAHIYAGTPMENVHDAIVAGTYSEPPHRYGAAVNTAKLTIDQVREIRALYGNPATRVDDLARRFGVGRHTITNIGRYRSWASFP